MTRSDSPEDPAVPVTLPAQAETALTAMVSTPGCDFATLARAAGLDPARDFRGADLRGVDFGASDLSGFDFSGADLSGCNLSRAQLDSAIMTGARRGAGQRFLELRGHKGPIRCVAFSSKGSHIGSGGWGGELFIWDGNIISERCTSLRGHQGQVSCIAFSLEGSLMVSGGEDRTLRLWDVSTGSILVESLHAHDSGIRSVDLSPDGSRIVSGGEDGTLRLWDASTGEALGEPFRGHEAEVLCVTYSPDGSRIASGGEDRTLRLWDASTGAPLSEPLRGHEGSVYSVAFSPNGSRLVSGSGDTTLRLWDGSTSTTLGGHERPVNCAAFSPDGNRIVSSGDDRKVIVWFLDPPAHQVFVTTRPEDEPYKRKLLDKLFAHPEMMKRNVVEAVLDPMANPRPDEGARDALENSVAALFIVGDKDLAFMQHGELELARQLQRKTGQPRIIPVFISSAIPTEPPDALKGYHFVQMPLDKPAAFNSLIEAICQAVDETEKATVNPHDKKTGKSFSSDFDSSFG